MNFEELVKERYSVREFSDKRVEEEKLIKILEAGRVAPTAKNNQPQRIYVLQSEEAIMKINSVCRCIFGAKTVLMICSDIEEEWKNSFTGENMGNVDCGIVCTHMMLQAWELGIGSCWVGYFDPQVVKKEFNLPENQRVVSLLPIGYAAEGCQPAPRHSSRKELNETVKYL